MNSYTFEEVDRILAGGDVNGKLSRDDLPTPALLLDLDAFEANVSKMARYCADRNLALRPHGKTHKCPELAKKLIRAGAVGSCCAKLGEAEVFAASGVSGLLITTPVIGERKIRRAVALAARFSDTMFVVDNPVNVRDLNDAAGTECVKLNVIVDLLVGGKGGIPTGQPALELAGLIASMPHLRFAGLQAYAGHASHVEGFARRKDASLEALAPALETRRLLERSGIECGLMTGGSTGTYEADGDLTGIDELQPGSFIFMDSDYNRIGGRDGAVYADFANSLSVLTTVVSKPSREMAIVDGGYKAFATDRPFMPESKSVAGITYSWGGDEHGRVAISHAAREIELGDQLEFIVPHCDPTVNLYDRIYCLRGDSVEAAWTIAARGKSQ